MRVRKDHLDVGNESQGAYYPVEALERVHWAAFTGEDSDLGGSHSPAAGQRHHQGQNDHSFLISGGYFIKDSWTALRHKELLWCSIYKIINNLMLFTSKKKWSGGGNVGKKRAGKKGFRVSAIHEMPSPRKCVFPSHAFVVSKLTI